MALRPTTPPTIADRNAASQDVFMREVDEALRQDQMVTLAKSYGWPIGIAVTAGLLALGAWLGWGHWRDRQAGERGEKYTQALDKLGSGAIDAAATDLIPLSKDGSDASKAAASLTRAGILLGTNKRDEAVKIYAAVAADGSAPQPYRDLATIRQVAATFDSLPPQQVIARLKPLAVPGNPFFGTAGELTGMAYLKANQPQLAAPLFGAIARDKSVPDSLRTRAGQLAAVLGVDTVDQFIREDAAVSAPAAKP